MTHVGGGTRPALAPLIGAGGLRPWPCGGFVGAQSATATRPSHSHSQALAQAPAQAQVRSLWLLVSPRILPWHDSRGKSVPRPVLKPETRNNILDKPNQTKPPRQRSSITASSLNTSRSHCAAEAAAQPGRLAGLLPPHYLPPTLPTLSPPLQLHPNPTCDST